MEGGKVWEARWTGRGMLRETKSTLLGTCPPPGVAHAGQHCPVGTSCSALSSRDGC